MKNIFLIICLSMLLPQCKPTKRNIIKRAYWEMEFYAIDPCSELSIYSMRNFKTFENPYFDRFLDLLAPIDSTKSISVEVLIHDYDLASNRQYTSYFWVENDTAYFQDLTYHFDKKETPDNYDFKPIQLDKKETKKVLKPYQYFVDGKNYYLPIYHYFNCADCMIDGGGTLFIIRENQKNRFIYTNENCGSMTEFITGIETSKKAFEIMKVLDDIWKKYYYKN